MAGIDSNTKLLLHCDGSGTTFTDSSSSAHAVTSNGGASVVSGGKFLQGGSFDGTDDYLSVPTSTDFDFGTGDFCIDFWVKRATTSNEGVFSLYASSSSRGGFYIDSSNCYFRHKSNTSDISVFASKTELVANQWRHVAIVKSNTDIYIFINGVHATTSGGSGITSVDAISASFVFGNYSDGNNHYFNGELDEIRISKGSARIDDPNDPLYIASGVYTDGFTVPSAAYSTSVTYDYTDFTNLLLNEDYKKYTDYTNL